MEGHSTLGDTPRLAKGGGRLTPRFEVLRVCCASGTWAEVISEQVTWVQALPPGCRLLTWHFSGPCSAHTPAHWQPGFSPRADETRF